MAEYKFANTHEYIADDGGVYRVGLSAFAADSMGDITFVELPETGAKFSQGESFAIVESLKDAYDVYAPVDMEIVEVNAALISAPEMVNASPLGDAWLAKVKVINPAQLGALITQVDYDAMDKEGR